MNGNTYFAVNKGGCGWKGGVKSNPDESILGFFLRGL